MTIPTRACWHITNPDAPHSSTKAFFLLNEVKHVVYAFSDGRFGIFPNGHFQLLGTANRRGKCHAERKAETYFAELGGCPFLLPDKSET